MTHGLTERQAAVLKVVCASDRPLGASAIGRQLKLPPKSASALALRALATLLRRGLVRRLPGSNARLVTYVTSPDGVNLSDIKIVKRGRG